MITLSMSLVPYGYYAPCTLITGQIWSSHKGHSYDIKDANGNTLASGDVPKTKSGHRNPFHLLANIMNDISLQNKLNDNYITTKWD